MNCEICEQDMGNVLVILPIAQYRNGSFNTLVCLKCAKKSTAYCNKHKMPHLGFMDSKTACRRCINTIVKKETPRAGEIVDLLLNKLKNKEFSRVVQRYNNLPSIAGSLSVCLLRVLVTRASRYHLSIGEVIEDEILKVQSIDSILPPGY